MDWRALAKSSRASVEVFQHERPRHLRRATSCGALRALAAADRPDRIPSDPARGTPHSTFSPGAARGGVAGRNGRASGAYRKAAPRTWLLVGGERDRARMGSE